MAERQPLEELDDAFEGIATALGAKKHGSVAGGLSPEDAAVINHVMRLVAPLRLDHTMTTTGWLVFPLDGGERDIVLDPIRPGGQELVHISIFALVDLPDDSHTDARVREFLDEANRYYGAKWLRLGSSLKAISDLPLDGLTTEALESGMLRLADVVADAEPALERIGAGRKLKSSFRERGIPIRRTFRTPRAPVAKES